MKHLNYYYTLFFISIVFSSGLFAQDSTAQKYPLKIILKTGAVLRGKIIEQDSLNVQIKLNEGKIIKISKGAIESDQPFAYEFKNIPYSTDVNLNLSDGTQVNGRIISVDDTSLVFKTLSGIEMTIPLSLINTTRELKGEIINGMYYRRDPNQSHLFISPTARPVEAGKVYFTDYMVFFPSFTAGITNFMSVGAGISIFPGSKDQLLYGNLKVTFWNKTFNENNLCIAGGAAFVNNTSLSGGGGSLFYGLVTFSRNPFAFTIGLMNPESDNGPVLLFGGELRLSNSVKIISEDYYNPKNSTGVYSFGFRFFGDKVAGDFGLFTWEELLNESNMGFPFIPWLGFTYNL